MSKLKIKNKNGVWESVAPSQKEFDNVATQLAEVAKEKNSKVLSLKGVSVAHRGLSYLAPENTLQSYELAGQYGAWAIETDVRMTKDGVPVLYHDTDLLEKTGVSGAVKDKTFAEINALSYSQNVNGLDKYPNCKIATLEDYLKVANKYNLHCMIEVSGLTYVDIDKVLPIIYKYGVENRCIIIGAQAHCSYIRNKNPNIIVGLVTWGTVTEADLDYCASISPSVIGVASSDNYLSKNYVELAHSKGVGIYAYIENTQAGYLKCLEWGVDLIGTDNKIGVSR